ncbi:ATP-binding protein [Streptomyces chartreusis]
MTAPAIAESVVVLRKRASLLFDGWAMSVDEKTAAELVISELLTNAVMHGFDKVTLAVNCTGMVLEVSVVDHGESKSGTPQRDADEHGRGLAIVAALARDLHISELATGWCARACLDLDVQKYAADQA